ncbi:MAG: FHA domain-containing protein [Myxococcota bacterium]
MARRTPPPELFLRSVKGESEPSEFKLDLNRMVSIGRTGNVKIHDPLVSIHHAKVYYDAEERSYIVEDLSSANGTMVNGETIRGEARMISVGTDLRIGDTVLRVEQPRTVLAVIRPLFLAGLLLVVSVSVCGLLVRQCPADPLPQEGELVDLGKVGLTIPNYGPVTKLDKDLEFLWDHGFGFTFTSSHVATVSDGYQVLFLGDQERQRVLAITVDENRRWRLRGDLPRGEVRDDEVGAGGFPPYAAVGRRWEYDTERGQYVPASPAQLVVWYREIPPEAPVEVGKWSPPQPLGPIQVGQFVTSGRREQLSLFLSERRLYRAIRYLVCEKGFEGIKAQALDAYGSLVEFQPACIGKLRLDGLSFDAELVGLALDPVGRQALIDDVTTYYAGDPFGLFLSEADRAEFIAPLARDPGPEQGAVKLVVVSDLIEAPFDPYPSGDLVMEGPHALRPDGKATSREAAPVAHTERLPFPGEQGRTATVATRDCERLEIAMNGIVPRSASSFATVSITGCDAPRAVLTVPYAAGVYAKVDPQGTDVAVRVEVDSVGRVRTALISWRE